MQDFSFCANPDNHLGRVAGSASESLFEHLTVKGHLSTNGRDIGGLVGTSSKSTYSHIFTSGIIEGTKVSDLENLVELKDIKLPWQADRVLDEEYKAIESLNDDLSK